MGRQGRPRANHPGNYDAARRGSQGIDTRSDRVDSFDPHRVTDGAVDDIKLLLGRGLRQADEQLIMDVVKAHPDCQAEGVVPRQAARAQRFAIDCEYFASFVPDVRYELVGADVQAGEWQLHAVWRRDAQLVVHHIKPRRMGVRERESTIRRCAQRATAAGELFGTSQVEVWICCLAARGDSLFVRADGSVQPLFAPDADAIEALLAETETAARVS